MLRSWLIVIVVCLAVAGGLAYYKYSRIQAAIAFAAAFPEPVVAVEAVLATEESWQPVTSVTAEVVATRSVALSNELAGTIVAVGFESGDVVEAGQVLVRLDTSEELAQLAAARADAEIARLELARNQKLIASGAAAEEARDRAKASFDAAVAAVNRLLAVIEKKTLRAPFDAVTGLHVLEVGQYLDRGATITRLIGVDDEVWVDFTLPQQQADLAIGERILIKVPGSGRELWARVVAKDTFVNQRSRNLSIRALADNSEGVLLPGSLVTVDVPLGAPRPVTLVPITAVRRKSFGASVFVLAPAEEGARAAYRAERRVVELGTQRGDMVVVTSGVRPGEQVAAEGSFKLREGVLVDPSSVRSLLGDGGTASGG